MGFDFSKIDLSGQQARPIDPIEIFQASAIIDGSINDLWLAQGDALREWSNNRNDEDIAIVLNTGAGKTLVGLLIAQSLVNETRRQVVYACSSIQLVQQTADKARGYGLPVATYMRREFSCGDLYYRAEAPCVTTYQALFNGKTRFRTDDIVAAIFDDAHTAEHILRDQFSLTISRSELSETYDRIVDLFLPYHRSVGLATSYAELSSGQSSRLFLVPPCELRRNVEEIRRLLVEADLGVCLSTMFSWEYIQDHEDLCCLLLSDREATLTPPILPISTLPYFESGIRRVYLSATLSAPDNFVRAFGRQPDRLVAPSTTAGECERMILVPSLVKGVDDDIASAKEIIEREKTLILVPSFFRGEEWADIAQTPQGSDVSEAVHMFRNTKSQNKLTLAARYDGLDLPGDTCRMMVLDELPTGSGPLEKFQWERLNMQNSLRSMLATRIVQSFGRISRGMSDHGVVLVTGKGLVDWLLTPRNRSLLPKFLQKQIEIGVGISQQVTDTGNLQVVASACLSRDSNWIQNYTNHMKELPSDGDTSDLDKALRVALAESRFGEALWQRDFRLAAKVLNEILQDAFDFSHSTGAWLSLWLGFALELVGDVKAASYFYRKSHAAQTNIPQPAISASGSGNTFPKQVLRVSEQMRIGYSNSISIQSPKTIVSDLRPLDGKGSTRQVEESLRCLGQFLGLLSTRPDNEYGLGPDVLWLGDEGTAICMEVKNCKQMTSVYRKSDVGQLHNHIQWVKNNHQVSEIAPIFVGPLLPASAEASPSSDMRVIELCEFENLGNKLVSALEDAAARAFPLGLNDDLHTMFDNRGLLYPNVILSLNAFALRDISPKET